MQDDLIVVDDNELPGFGLDSATNPDYFYGNPATPATPATPMSTVSTSGRPRRAASMAQPPIISDSSDRLRSTQKSKTQPKLKLKLSEKAVAQAPGMSFLGPYDRELDSDDDEDLVFEEQFILRLPQGEDCEKLRKVVSSREVSDDVWLKFKGASTASRVDRTAASSRAVSDSRRGVFHIGNSTYSSRLVDLPCVIESQKTLDNKQMFKVADICQVLWGFLGLAQDVIYPKIPDAGG
jgi:transcription initiation factor TFIID subunit 7